MIGNPSFLMRPAAPLFFTLMAWLLWQPGDAFAKDWRGHRSKVDFPAYVRAIIGFPETLDRRKCLTYGRWKVCFGKKPPVANLLGCDRQACPHIRITGLVCKNRVTGEVKCELDLVQWRDGSPPSCDFSLGRGKSAIFIHTKCPKEMLLE